MHERIVLAARSQALQFKQSSTPDNSRLALLGMPRRALSLWLAFWQASLYGLRWLLVEAGRRTSLFPGVWQPARTRLIEEALVHGVECGDGHLNPSPTPPCALPHRRLCALPQVAAARRENRGSATLPAKPPAQHAATRYRGPERCLGSARRWTSWFRWWPLWPLPVR